jgi:L-histidine N-alpha-methyltransferase
MTAVGQAAAEKPAAGRPHHGILGICDRRVGPGPTPTREIAIATTRQSAHGDLLAGLREAPRSIPSKYFYDDRGSALFDAICDLPEYYPARTEKALLDELAPQIAEITRANELIELGSGTARKTRTLIAALLERGEGLRYAPLDISEYALEQATSAVTEEFPEVRVSRIACDYTRSLEVLDPDPGCLVAFLGSTVGNFRRDQGVALLGRLRERLTAGDWFLLGVDLIKPTEVLEAAYNDTAGLTAEFNRNILEAVNHHVQADFDPQAFEHLAFFSPTESQIEMHLVARRDLLVRLQALDLDVEISKGERIRTEISRKFTLESVQRLLNESGFAMRYWLPSPDHYFALALAAVDGD